MRWLLTALACFSVSGCEDTGRARIEVLLEGAGTGEVTLSRGDATLTLTRADVSFGPIYFCASAGAEAELCGAALLEHTETETLEALSAEPESFGELRGITGSVRSALYDYGISWLATSQSPAPNPGAAKDHSAVIEGVVERTGQRVEFLAQIDLPPRSRGTLAMNGQATRHELTERTARLRVIANPVRWFERVDLDELLASAGDGDGPLAIAPGSQAYEAIVLGMQNRAPLEFSWSDE